MFPYPLQNYMKLGLPYSPNPHQIHVRVICTAEPELFEEDFPDVRYPGCIYGIMGSDLPRWPTLASQKKLLCYSVPKKLTVARTYAKDGSGWFRYLDDPDGF